jgi:hypothetical protein
MEMMKALAGVLAGCLVLAMAAAAGAGIPDPDQSYVTMTAGGKGLVTCPAGDASAYSYITVGALKNNGDPIPGIPSGNFFFTVTGSGSGNISISAFDAETNISGECRFQAQGDGTVLYGSVTVSVQIYTVVVVDTGTLWCNTFDYDDNGTVDPIDFSAFAADFGTSNEESDFDWNGTVDPIDFSSFAGHFGH